jgi:tetratricopeptide (TPR) repeat protein
MRPWLVLVAFVLVAFATYAPSLNGEFIWDDHYLVGDNPFFRSPIFALEVFRHHLFSESFSTYYRPVQNLSYMLDYWLWGDSPAGYHATNIILHALAAWMLFLLLLRLIPGLWNDALRAPIAALLVALAWLVHPVHNAAVAYISGRADSLAAVFALSAWLLWAKSRELRGVTARGGVAVVASLSLLAALCSKEIALMWVVIFLIHTIFFDTSMSRRARVGVVAGLAGIVAVYAVLHSLPEPRAGVPGAVAEPFASRVILMLRALGDYCGLMLAPVRLMMERTLGSEAIYASRQGWWRGIASEYLSVLGVFALLAAAGLWVRRGEAKSLRRFGAVWLAVAFVPISNLIPLNAQVAEHWIYLASIGFLLLLAGSVAMLPSRARRWCAVLALPAVVALAARTGFRAAEWADAEKFARGTIANGGASGRILVYLGEELGRKNRLAEQEALCRKTLTLFPDYMTARISLGLCLQKQGRAEEARPLLDIGRAGATVATVPRTWNAALNTAGQLHKEGRSAEALHLVREWQPLHPHTWELAGFEANVLHETEGPGAALAVVENYARAHWWHLPSQLGMASLQREVGDFQPALATARHAQRLDIRGAAAFDEAARTQAALGRFAEALESQAMAVARAPSNPEYLDFFSAVLVQLGRRSEALAVRQKAELLATTAGRKLL